MKTATRDVNRRKFLAVSGIGAATLGLTGGLVEAAEWTAEERANVKLIEDFFTVRWSLPLDTAKIGAFLADDCLRGGEDIAFRGREAILEGIKNQDKGRTRLKSDFTVVQAFARGPIVMNERIEHSTYPDRVSRWHGVGVFRVKDGKIKEWRTFGMGG
jgi:hypothetical protein